jgi:hypothetical protein
MKRLPGIWSPAAAPGRGALTIVRVLRVVDTRDYELVGDRAVPVPGSGTERECDRCQRTHVVHAHVQLSDGSAAIVGTGCMGSADMAKRARSLAAKAKRDRTAEIALAHERVLVAELDRAVAMLPAPPVHTIRIVDTGDKYSRYRAEMGDAWVMLWKSTLEAPDRQSLIRSWREHRLAELGITHRHYMAQREVERSQRR